MALPTRRSYAGAAVECTLTSSISAGDTHATLTGTVTNWPTTGAAPAGPFYMVIDPGLTTEEKVLVTARASGSLTITRGQDGTAPAAHIAGAVAYPVGAAVDFDEANSALSTMTTKGDLLVTTGSAYARLPVGTNGYLLKGDSSAANGVSWTDYSASPTFTGTPLAPTATAGTNTTQLATMASQPYNTAWGKVSLVKEISSDGSITSEEVQITTASFTAVTNRLYKITYYEPQVYGSVQASYGLAIRKGTTTGGDKLNEAWTFATTLGFYGGTSCVAITTLIAGAQQVCGTLLATAGTGVANRTSTDYAFLLVEDIGPS